MGVEVTHGAWESQVNGFRNQFAQSIGPRDVHGASLPLVHEATRILLHVCLHAGASIVSCPLLHSLAMLP